MKYILLMIGSRIVGLLKCPGLQDLARFGDRLMALAGYRVEPRSQLTVHGRLQVWHEDGTLMVDHKNMVVDDGLEYLVDKLVAAGNINIFKYVGFGTGTGATAGGTAALGTELAGGTYARLDGTQGEGASSKVYRVSGTWTNNSASNPAAVTEYGLFSAATDGVLFARVSTGDASPPATKTVATGETITVQWDFTLADA